MMRYGRWLQTAAAATWLGAQPVAARDVPEGVEADLTVEGLALLGDVLSAPLRDTLRDVAVPDVRDTLAGGVETTLTEVRASMAVASLAIVPTAAGLALDVGLSQVRVDVGAMLLQWGLLETTCTDTVIHVAEDSVVHLTGILTPSVVAEDIRLAADALRFPVGYDDYRAAGPAACSGWWGVRDVARLVASGVLKSLWPFVEEMVTSRLAATLPALEAQLNDQTHLSVMFDVRDLPPLPERTAELSAFPSAVTVDERGLRLVAGFRIRRVDSEAVERPAREVMAPAVVRLASLGLNPMLLTAALAEVFPDGTAAVELTEEMIPNLGEILKARSLASIWPDLQEAPLSGDRLRLFARLAAPPALAADQPSQAVQGRFPHIELRYLAPIEGAWIEYFVIDLTLAVNGRLEASDGELRFGLLPTYDARVEGRWGDGYQPRRALFERDMFEVVLATLLDYTREAGPLMRISAPPFDVGGRRITVGNPHVRAPYLRVDALGE